ncbi:MAG: ABC transporter permease subunit [Planctomycetes bacterium]|nr:ABC transporter permease subunit [Planctomycetota bacterium]
MNVTRLKRLFELPLLAKELNEQSAQARTYVLRFLYGAILFTAACGMFYGTFLLGGTGASGGLGQGRQMFEQLVTLQFWTIFLFLPAVSCGCLSIEKERNTLALLLITSLTPWQIVFQKLLGRLVPMLTYVILSFPLMAVAYSFGGFTEAYLWSGIILLVITCVEAGALSVMCSAWYATTVEAFIANYVIFLVLLSIFPICWGPWLFQQAADVTLGVTLGRLPYPAIMTGIFLIAARIFLPARAFIPPKNVLLGLFHQLDNFFNNANTVTGGVVLVKDGDPLPNLNPIAWRETTKKSLGTFRYLFRVLVAMELPLIVVCASLQISSPGGPDVRIVSRLLYVLWCLGGAMIIVHAASVIASERTRQTFDVLLATPLSGRQILTEKLAGVQRLLLILLVPFFTLFGFETWWHQGGQYRWLYLLLSAGTVAAYLPILKWFALWMGLKIKSQMKAVLTTMGLVAAWLMLPDIIRAVVTDMIGRNLPGWCEALFSLNPKTQIPVIEELNTTARFASSRALREGFWPFILLTCANFSLYAGAAWLIRRQVLNHADHLLGRLEPPATSGQSEPAEAPVIENGELNSAEASAT